MKKLFLLSLSLICASIITASADKQAATQKPEVTVKKDETKLTFDYQKKLKGLLKLTGSAAFGYLSRYLYQPKMRDGKMVYKKIDMGLASICATVSTGLAVEGVKDLFDSSEKNK